MESFDVDVCIVGGGPAGVIAAYAIAKAGYSCIILDKKDRNKIGEKNCGDALDGMHVALIYEHLGIEGPSIDNGEARDLIKKFTIAAKSLESKFSVLYHGFLVDRLIYGQRLLKQAEDMGVQLFPDSTVRNLLIENDQVVGVKYFDSSRVEQKLRAKITIDASGFIGVIRKLLPDKLTNGVNYHFRDEDVIATYREIIEIKSDKDHPFREEIILIYHDQIKPPGYAWIFSEGEKKLNIGITWVKSDDYPVTKSLKSIYHDCLDPYFNPSEYEVIQKGGGNIPMRPNFDSLVFNGGMIIGDAAALADPTTFEGHGPALESGRLAAITAIKALEKNSFSTDDLWEFNSTIMTYPGIMHAQSYIAAQLLREIGPDGLHFILDREIITEAELRAIFQDKNAKFSLLSKIKKFFKAFPKWKLMFVIKKYMDLIDKAERIYGEYPTSPKDLSNWRIKRNKNLKVNF